MLNLMISGSELSVDVIRGMRVLWVLRDVASKENIFLHPAEPMVEEFAQWTEALSLFEPRNQVNALFEGTVKLCADHRICPLSSMALDAAKLAESGQDKIQQFCELHRSWMVRVIDEDQEGGQFLQDMSSDQLASLVTLMFLGAQLDRLIGTQGERSTVASRQRSPTEHDVGEPAASSKSPLRRSWTS